MSRKGQSARTGLCQSSRLVSIQGRKDGVPTVRAEVDRAVSNAAANVVSDADREVVAVNERHYISLIDLMSRSRW